MKLPIEQWAIERRFSNKVLKLINESIICYKHGAYRATLLFSYLGFITFIKESLIQGKKPDSISKGRWSKIQGELQDDDKWEKRVFEELINSSSPVFNIKEDIRQQVKYWKDRRNDCAHFKNNEIEAHHVESFWSFLTSNLSKITIEGGRASLIKKFNVHFDSTKTPPNTDLTYLIREIEHAVELNEFKSFLKELYKILDPVSLYMEDIQKVHNKILEICSSQLVEVMTQYLKKENMDVELIASFPDKVNFMNYDKTELRELWKKRIFESDNDRFIFAIYAALLRNNLIPTNQLEEAFEHLFDKYEQTKHHVPTDLNIMAAFVNQKLGEIIFEKAIVENELKSFMWVNSKCDLIAFYIENYPLKKETVEKLCAMIGYANYSWWLEDAIVQVFEKNGIIKSQFHKIASQNGYTMPNKFQ